MTSRVNRSTTFMPVARLVGVWKFRIFQAGAQPGGQGSATAATLKDSHCRRSPLSAAREKGKGGGRASQ